MAKHNNNFRQLLNFFDIKRFRKSAVQHEADRYVKKFFAKDLFITLICGFLSTRDSLRQLEHSLNQHSAVRKSLGMPEVFRNTISQALSNRPSELFYQHLLHLFEQLNSRINQRKSAGMKTTALDATFINLAKNLFDWARYKKKFRGIKLHVILACALELPEYCSFSLGDEQELTIAWDYYHLIPKDRIVVCDKAYFSWEFLTKMENDGIEFVIPGKNNLAFEVESEIPEDQLPEGIIADQIVVFTSQIAAKYGSVVFRRIVVWCERKNKEVDYITNLWETEADEVLEIYGQRWKIEEFFRLIKRTLKIESFWGRSRNAVEIQIYVALMVTMVLKYMAICANPEITKGSPFYLHRFLANMLFERTDLKTLLNIDFNVF